MAGREGQHGAMGKAGQSSKQRQIVMDPADAAAFSRALIEAFPGIRFLPYEYWSRRVPGETWRRVDQRPPPT